MKNHQLESAYSTKKSMLHQGEINSARPKNSLLDADLDFKQKAVLKTTKQDEELILKIIATRIKNEQFDNMYVKEEKEEEEVVELSSDNEISDDQNLDELIEEIRFEITKMTDYNYEVDNFEAKPIEKNVAKTKKVDRRKESQQIKNKLKKNKNVQILD